MLRRTFIQAGSVAGLMLGGPAWGQEQQAEPDRAVLLTVRLAEGGQEKTLAEFTLKDLKSMPITRFQTKTVWTEGTQEFTGVALSDLMKQLEITAGTVEAWAINDYLAEIPMTDARPEGPIIAYLRNGDEMSVREKGPLWVVYPYDSDPAYQREEIYVRSVWQLNRLILNP
ncbi:molybdopterin-dependent oxidoreductase [Aliisedimentitalea scapharcae]|uniref:Molybdopterin-dependent oxidoreductase n=1 Tax=Aliisedimentitalea scapharcae TaxID=1524259 RepID=A0ABZ2XNZ7_9RHOB